MQRKKVTSQSKYCNFLCGLKSTSVSITMFTSSFQWKYWEFFCWMRAALNNNWESEAR